MKRFLAVFTVVAVIQVSQLIAQSKENTSIGRSFKSSYALFAGVEIMGKAGLNTKVAQGRKTDVNFNSLPDFALTTLIPFQKDAKLGFGLNVGYASYSYGNKPESGVTDNTFIKEQYGYISIFPHFYLMGVIAGLNIGIPSGGTTVSKSDLNYNVTNGSIVTNEVDYSSYMATMMELQLGVKFPVVEEKVGRLNVGLMLGYCLTGIYNDASQYYYSADFDGVSRKANSDNNPKPVSISIGLSWQFRIPM